MRHLYFPCLLLLGMSCIALFSPLKGQPQVNTVDAYQSESKRLKVEPQRSRSGGGPEHLEDLARPGQNQLSHGYF